MPVTKDRVKLGRTTYKVTITRNEYDEPAGETTRHDVKHKECRSKEAAIGFLTTYMPLFAKGTTHDITGQISKGTYIDNTFDDDTYGHIMDAEWDQDEQFHCYAWMPHRLADSIEMDLEEVL